MRAKAIILGAVAASTVSAANCWPSVSNGIYTSYYVGTQLAWDLRSTLCTYYWNSNTRVQTYHGANWGDCGTDWKGTGTCWGGYFVSSLHTDFFTRRLLIVCRKVLTNPINKLVG
jgi:hypothetical protein